MNEPTLFDVPTAPIRDETDSIIELMCGDPLHANDRRAIVRAIVAEAHASGGRVDPNRLRARLVNDQGHLTVFPRLMGSTVGGLVRRGVLQHAGWVRSTDRVGRNTNKQLPVYRLVQKGQAAA